MNEREDPRLISISIISYSRTCESENLKERKRWFVWEYRCVRKTVHFIRNEYVVECGSVFFSSVFFRS